jgi:hypothetical protein
VSRALDNRRVKDVRAKRQLTLEEFYGDEELLRLGYNGDPKVMVLRLARHRQLAEEGRGPIAEMHADLVAMGYRSRYKPFYPPGSERLPRVED